MPAPRRYRTVATPPFRLDLTVAVLRRLPANPVEGWSGGRYVRAFHTERGPVAWAVTQPGPGPSLRVELHGPTEDLAPWRTRVERALGLRVDLGDFYARANRLPEVRSIVRAMRGVKPPRFQSLDEAITGVVLFQQVSLAAAMAMYRRLVVALAPPLEVAGVTVHPFPSAASLEAASEATLRGFGLSAAKARALRAAATAIASGRLSEDRLAALPSPALRDLLLTVPGIGPWSADLLMLRGFGRLDAFPPGDAAADKLLERLGSGRSGRYLLTALGPYRGMLYYHLFLDRLARERRGPFADPAPDRDLS